MSADNQTNQANGQQASGATDKPPVAESAASNEAKKDATPPPATPKQEPKTRKLFYVGEDKPATGKVRIGMSVVELPDETSQRAGFEIANADLIRRALSGYSFSEKKRGN